MMSKYKFTVTTNIEAYSEQQARDILHGKKLMIRDVKLKNPDPKPRKQKDGNNPPVARSGELIGRVQLNCPKHGYQYVYGFKRADGKGGICCSKCYEHLPVENNI